MGGRGARRSRDESDTEAVATGRAWTAPRHGRYTTRRVGRGQRASRRSGLQPISHLGPRGPSTGDPDAFDHHGWLGARCRRRRIFRAGAETGTLKKIKDTGAITIGYRESSIPFSYLDDKQQPIGYAMDLCMKVVDAVKSELKMPNLKVNLQP
jgi:ABC-type amino acid transport substrate-binding protein